MESQNNMSANNVPSVGKLTDPWELFKSSWQTFAQNWKLLVLAFLLPIIFIFLGGVIASGITFFNLVIGVIFMVLVVIVGSVGMMFAYPGAMRSIASIDRDPSTKIGVKQLYKDGMKYFWPFLWISAITGAIVFGMSIIFFIPGIIVGGYMIASMYALMAEDKRGLSAIVYSYSLVKGRWWAVFGRMAFLALLAFLASFVLSMILSLLMGILAVISSVSVFGIVGLAITFILRMVEQLAIYGIFYPLTLIYTYKLYVSLKQNPVTLSNPEKVHKTFKWMGIWGIVVMVGFTGLMIAMVFITNCSFGMDRWHSCGSTVKLTNPNPAWDTKADEYWDNMKLNNIATTTDPDTIENSKY